MNFNNHYNVKGHAFLSPSSYHWVNYDDDHLRQKYNNALAAQKGTELHALAESMIKNRIKAANHKRALNMFVNDAIGFGMEPEVILYYSDHCYGTADAIKYEEATKDKPAFLRIHDLKTGVTPVKMTQLEVYAAIFCLEYNVKPHLIEMELRIYQGNNYVVHIPEHEAILDIMQKIVHFDKVLNEHIDELV